MFSRDDDTLQGLANESLTVPEDGLDDCLERVEDYVIEKFSRKLFTFAEEALDKRKVTEECSHIKASPLWKKYIEDNNKQGISSNFNNAQEENKQLISTLIHTIVSEMVREWR